MIRYKANLYRLLVVYAIFSSFKEFLLIHLDDYYNVSKT